MVNFIKTEIKRVDVLQHDKKLTRFSQVLYKNSVVALRYPNFFQSFALFVQAFLTTASTAVLIISCGQRKSQISSAQKIFL
jgi:menaquinone-dependent protoporphyrinogen IX oxidase